MRTSQLFGFYKVFTAKYTRIFLRSNGWISLLSTAIITSLIVLVVGKSAFDTYSSTRSAAFALVCSCIWIGLFNSIQTVCSERATIKQEMHSGVHYTSFLVGHLVFEVFLCLIETALVVAILTGLYGNSLAPDDQLTVTRILGLYLIFFLIIYSSDVLGLMISSLVKTPHQAMTIMPFVLIMQLIMSGFLFKLSGIANWLSYATLAKWGLKGTLLVWGVNEMPIIAEDDGSTTEQMRQLEFTFNQQTLNDNFSAYEASSTNLMLIPTAFFIFLILQIAFTALGIKRIQKDRR